MAERSLLNKLRLVLDVARTGEAEDLRSLVDRIEAEGYGAFSTRRYDPEIDDAVVVQSRRSISKAVRLASELGLIEADAAPTKAIVRALMRDRFEKELADACWERLAQLGCGRDRVRDVALDLVGQVPAAAPTVAELFARLQPSCSRQEFSSTLNLLANCGGISTFQRRLYFVPESGRRTRA